MGQTSSALLGRAAWQLEDAGGGPGRPVLMDTNAAGKGWEEVRPGQAPMERDLHNKQSLAVPVLPCFQI